MALRLFISDDARVVRKMGSTLFSRYISLTNHTSREGLKAKDEGVKRVLENFGFGRGAKTLLLESIK
ncbi:hypothetical protein M1N92_06850 [Dehalococcoidia bacterium]|nr:hypothetical protein [Dehalococcoidia bacterium]